MDVDYAEVRQRDNDALPYYPLIVFSSNFPVPDMPGLIRGAGSWQGKTEPSYAIPTEEAWRIMPYIQGQEAVLHLGQRLIGQSTRVARILWQDAAIEAEGHPLLETLKGRWTRVDAADIPAGADFSQFGGQFYTIS